MQGRSHFPTLKDLSVAVDQVAAIPHKGNALGAYNALIQGVDRSSSNSVPRLMFGNFSQAYSQGASRGSPENVFTLLVVDVISLPLKNA